MQKLVWQNSNGDVIDLTSGNYNITNWEGFSNADLNIQSQQVPFQDGGVFLDALIEQRELSVTLAMQDNGNLEERYRMRRELIHALNPKLGEGYLIYTNDFISKRIKCVAQIPLFETHNSNDSGTPKASLAWTACEPYWEDVEETEISFGISSMPLINNNGDCEVPVKIIFNTNNAQNVEFENYTTAKKIKINGNITSPVFINTENGKKEVRTENIEIGICNIKTIEKIVESPFGYFAIADGNILKTENNKQWFSKLALSSSFLHFSDIVYSLERNIFIAVALSYVFVSTDNGNTWLQSSDITDQYHYLGKIIYDVHLHRFLMSVGNSSDSSDNKILSSEDGFTWNLEISINSRISSMCYIESISKYVILTNTQFDIIVYMGNKLNNITISFSSDRPSSLGSIAYSNDQNKIVIAGTHILITSTDNGATWVDRTIDTDEVFSNIAYSEKLGLFILISNKGIWNSTNAINWNKKYTTLDSQLSNVTYAEKQSLFLISGNEIIGTSNGEDILFLYKTGVNIARIQDSLFYKKNKEYIAITNNVQSASYNVISSLDGQNWDIKHSFEDGHLYCITHIETKNLFMIGGSFNFSNKLLLSSDLTDWEEINFSHRINKIIYAEKIKKTFALCISANNNSPVYRSENITNWNLVATLPRIMNDIIYSEINSLFTTVGEDGFIYNSADGVTWVGIVTTIQEYSLMGVCFSKALNVYVAVGTNGTILFSSDSLKWEIVDIDVQNDFTSVKYCESKGMFVATGENGIYATSYNGLIWNVNNTKVNNELTVVVEGSDILICGNDINFISQDKEGENIISSISKDSDMNLKLKQGENRIRISKTSGNVICNLKYRQKYIGV
jgi:photosystem II stability/assembly factor-like uncharacterized protein